MDRLRIAHQAVFQFWKSKNGHDPQDGLYNAAGHEYNQYDRDLSSVDPHNHQNKGAFTADNTLLKLAFLAIMELEKTWMKRAFNWKSILNQFMMIGFQRKFWISALLASVVLFSAIAKVSFAFDESRGQALRVQHIKFAYRTNFKNRNLDFRRRQIDD